MTEQASALKRGRNPRFPFVPVTIRDGRASQVRGVAFATREEAVAFAQKAIDLRNAHHAAAAAAYEARR